MRNREAIAALTISFILGRAVCNGQPTSDASHQPTAAAVRAKIAFLAGSYVTATTLPPSSSMPKGATGKGTSLITWALDSMFLSIQEESLNSLLGQYKGYGMLGYDPQLHEFVLSMFNNFGDHPVYHGGFAGDTLILMTKVPAPKAPFDQKLLWYRDSGTVRLEVLNDMGKGLVPVLEQTATPAPR